MDQSDRRSVISVVRVVVRVVVHVGEWVVDVGLGLGERTVAVASEKVLSAYKAVVRDINIFDIDLNLSKTL